MSIVTLLMDDLQRPVSLFDQHFGLGKLQDESDLSGVAPHPFGYYRPWHSQAARNSGMSHLQRDNTGFKVSLDVQQFKPNELTVKTANNFVVVEGKHEERQDEHGFISRQFQRRYRLPSDVEADTVVSRLSSDGVLSIYAQKKALSPPVGERIVPITQTQAPAMKANNTSAGETQKIEF